MKRIIISAFQVFFLNLAFCFLANAQTELCGVNETSAPASLSNSGTTTISKDTVANLMKSVISSFGIKTDGTGTIKVAVEVDSLLRAQFKDSASCYAYIRQLYNKVDSIYFKEINVHISICSFDILKHSNVYGENNQAFSSQVCTSFENTWNTKHSNISRTVAQLLTWEQYGGGGYGILNALGNTNAYSVAGITAAEDTSYYPFTQRNVSSYSYDIYIVAHELSHNCGAHHTASCFYGFALDTCSGAADACLPALTGAQDNFSGFKYYYNRGSILSYCVNPGPVSPYLSFILQNNVAATGINSAIAPQNVRVYREENYITVTSAYPVSSYTLYDALGRQVESRNVSGNEIQISSPKTFNIMVIRTIDNQVISIKL